MSYQWGNQYDQFVTETVFPDFVRTMDARASQQIPREQLHKNRSNFYNLIASLTRVNKRKLNSSRSGNIAKLSLVGGFQTNQQAFIAEVVSVHYNYGQPGATLNHSLNIIRKEEGAFVSYFFDNEHPLICYEGSSIEYNLTTEEGIENLVLDMGMELDSGKQTVIANLQQEANMGINLQPVAEDEVRDMTSFFTKTRVDWE